MNSESSQTFFSLNWKTILKKLSGKILLFADKIANIYEMLKQEYAKLINDNVTKTQQKRTTSTKKKTEKKQNILKKTKTQK